MEVESAAPLETRVTIRLMASAMDRRIVSFGLERQCIHEVEREVDNQQYQSAGSRLASGSAKHHYSSIDSGKSFDQP